MSVDDLCFKAGIHLDGVDENAKRCRSVFLDWLSRLMLPAGSRAASCSQARPANCRICQMSIHRFQMEHTCIIRLDPTFLSRCRPSLKETSVKVTSTANVMSPLKRGARRPRDGNVFRATTSPPCSDGVHSPWTEFRRRRRSISRKKKWTRFFSSRQTFHT